MELLLVRSAQKEERAYEAQASQGEFEEPSTAIGAQSSREDGDGLERLPESI